MTTDSHASVTVPVVAGITCSLPKEYKSCKFGNKVPIHDWLMYFTCMQAGALYTIYTIHKTQPAYKGLRVRAYIPVTSVQAVSDLLLEARRAQVPDIPAIIKCLVREDAFVCGGVRRPPAGRQVIRDGPARCVPCFCLTEDFSPVEGHPCEHAIAPTLSASRPRAMCCS